MEEFLDDYPKRIRDNLRINKKVFLYIKNLLCKKYKLQGTRYIRITKQLGIFFYVIIIDLSIKELAELLRTGQIRGTKPNLTR
jgi:hypothetical protein